MTAFQLALMFLFANPIDAKDNFNAKTQFSELKFLVGVWVEEGSKTSNFEIVFELTANNTTLIETWLNKGKKHSLTVYHLDGNSVIATHYCPQGNQPRLELVESSTGSSLFFKFRDATNLISPDHSHQHSLNFDLSKMPNKIVRGESYLSKAGEKASKLVLVRKE